MSARTITFRELSKRLARRQGQTWTDADTPLDGEKTKYAQFLSDASRVCWDAWPWPEAVIELEDFTLTDGYLVPWASISNASWAEVWTANPSKAEEARRLDHTQGVNGLELVKPWRQALQQVFVRCRPDAPMYSWEAFDGGGTDYLRGDVVYDAESGNCFAAVVDAPGADLTNPTKWALQPVLLILAASMVCLAQADYKISQGEPDFAAPLESKGRQLLEKEWLLLRQLKHFGN